MKIIKTAKWKEKIDGGKAHGHEPSEYDVEQLRKGVKIEMEHTPDPQIAKEISMDHLQESKDKKGEKGGKYYDLLEDMEKTIKNRIKNK